MYSIHGARAQAACWLSAEDSVHQVSPERKRIERKKGSIWSLPGPRGLFLIMKRKETEKDKGGTTSRAAHICSLRTSGARPLLGAEGRPGGPVADSSQPTDNPIPENTQGECLSLVSLIMKAIHHSFKLPGTLG